MLASLAADWGLLLLRGLAAVAFGTVALVWPGLTLPGLALLFGLYALFDGILALSMAFAGNDAPGTGALLFEGFVRIAAGFAVIDPGVVTAFPRFVAVWAILTAITELIIANHLRHELSGEWPLPFAAFVSLVIGLLLVVSPADLGAPGLSWLLGPYAVIYGWTLLVLAWRLRQLAQEMAKT